ncbi:hypothetical protein BH10PSE4_BH10PSE4_31440 [soil metagenome]
MADKAVYSTNEILTALQTEWSKTDNAYREWEKPTVYFFIGDTSIVGDGLTGESLGWTTMATDQWSAAFKAFSIWDELITDINLVATTDVDDADITIAYSSTTDGGGTYTKATRGTAETNGGVKTYPITGEAIWLSTTNAGVNTGALGLSGYGFNTYLHEIGHSLGLSHPGPYNATDVPAPTYADDALFTMDSRQYSIMSYFDGETESIGWVDGGQYFSSTPMVYDIAAIQAKYGADYTTRPDDTTYGYNSTAGWDFFNFAVTEDAKPVFTIWDGGGVDTIDASLYDKAQTIDLRPGAYSSVLGLTDNIAIALEPAGSNGRSLIENAIGGSGDDVLTGNYGANLLVGNDGDDVLDSGGLAGGYVSLTDTLTGGAGHDTFVFAPGDHHVTITDFSVVDDVLDLTAVTQVHDVANLLSYAHQDGADMVIDFGASGASHDVLRLQNVTYAQLYYLNPLSLAATASPTITITPNPADNISPMAVSVAPLAGGGFVATRFSALDYASQQIFAFRYDASGALVDSVKVNVDPSDAVQVRAIGLSSGKTLVIWDSLHGGDDGGHAIIGRLLDETGTPMGNTFTINTTHFAPGGYQAQLTVYASSNGGADVEYYMPSSLIVDGQPVYFTYRAGISADGAVVGEINLGTGYQGTYAAIHSIPGYDYYVEGGHAFYKQVGHEPVQLDDGDFYPDGVGLLDQPPFQAMRLTDGRILFSYLSGYIVDYSQWVVADKVVILNADGNGFTKPGTDADDYLQGGPGADQLYGHGGNDTLMGMGGGDLLDGGTGTDTAAYSRATEGVTVDLSLTGPQAGTGEGAGDRLVSIENLIGSAFDDRLSGDAGPNLIEGGKGDDGIYGNGGGDTLLGGAGDDAIYLTANVTFNDPVPVARGGDGKDHIEINGDSAAAYGDDGDDRISVNGNHNMVDGGNGDNTLIVTAGDGNTLYGGAGRDFLIGGPGDDILYGGGGDDNYFASAGHDIYDDGGADRDYLFYEQAVMADFAISYDPASGMLRISDTRAGAPYGVASVRGIEMFFFKDGERTLAQVQAAAGVPSLVGHVVDGYVAGATVFADTDGDRMLGGREASTQTGPDGSFTLVGGEGTLVATGGTDISTGLPLGGVLLAPEGSTMITPLTTLVVLAGERGVEVGPLMARLGLPAGFDLLHADPVALAGAGDTDGIAVLIAGAQVQDTIALIAAALASKGLDPNPSLTAIQAVATVLASHVTVDFTNLDDVAAIVAAAGLQYSAADALAHVAAATNTSLAHASGSSTVLDDIAFVENAVQGGAANALYYAGSDPVALYAVVARFAEGADPHDSPPMAVDDVVSANGSTALVFTAATLLSNDSDPDGQALTLIGADAAVHGSVWFDPDAATATFTPDEGFTGEGSFTYVVTDGHGAVSSATVTIHAGIVDHPVTAVDDSLSLDPDEGILIVDSSLLSNDIALDGGLHVLGGVVGGALVATLTTAKGGSVNYVPPSGGGPGFFHYEPAAGFLGQDSFTYRAADGDGSISDAVVMIQVGPVDHNPVTAVDDSLSLDPGDGILIVDSSLLSNDIALDGGLHVLGGVVGGALVATLTTAKGGSVNYVPPSGGGPGFFHYEPANGFLGADSFTYRAADGDGSISDAVVTINVTGPHVPGAAVDGGAGADRLNGTAGDDLLRGFGGIDALNGLEGADTLIGGLGNDTYIVDNAADLVIENPGEGYDAVRASVASYTLVSNVELLSFVGSGNFVGTGNALTNAITGGAGNDTLDGAGGVDVLTGGLGSDTYKVDTIADQVVEQAGQGTDTVLSTARTFALSANVENLQFVGTGDFRGFGNALDNHITGGAGNDGLDGGIGADTLAGGLGDDVYFIDSASDDVVEAANAGADRILTKLSVATAAENIEQLIYYGLGAFQGHAAASGTAIFGGGGADTLVGASGADLLAGMGGNDVLTGNGGADLFYFDAPGLGIDQITDFQIGMDHIELRATTFGVASLADLGFDAGLAPTASGSQPTILYDTVTGDLYFDATGGDSSDKVQIATLTGKPALTLNDFMVA